MNDMDGLECQDECFYVDGASDVRKMFDFFCGLGEESNTHEIIY
ncbi:hypothetical protein [Bulleidia extructa]